MRPNARVPRCVAPLLPERLPRAVTADTTVVPAPSEGTAIRFRIAIFLLTAACLTSALAAPCVSVYRRAMWVSQVSTMARRPGVVETSAGGQLRYVSFSGSPRELLGVEYGPAGNSSLDLIYDVQAAFTVFREPQRVHLCYTEFGDNEVPLLLDAPTLQQLDLKGTRLTDQGVISLARLPHLRGIYLNHTAVGDAGIGALSHCPKLSLLGLRETRVTDRALQGLQRTTTLEILDLSDTAVSGDGLQVLRDLKRLETLHLAGLRIGDDDVPHLAGFRCLSFLDLSRTAISDRGLRELSKTFPGALLRVERTQVTPAGVCEFQRLRPEVQLQHSVECFPDAR
jgi:hypothetical protein